MTVQELIDELEKLPPDWRVLVLSDANCAPANPNFYDLDWFEANDVDEDSGTGERLDFAYEKELR